MIPKFSQINCRTNTFLVPVHCVFQLSTSSCLTGPIFEFKISPYSLFIALASFQLTLTGNKKNCLIDMMCSCLVQGLKLQSVA